MLAEYVVILTPSISFCFAEVGIVELDATSRISVTGRGYESIKKLGCSRTCIRKVNE
jgi:hypothetical protein